jgi:amino acid transporter
MGRTLPWSGEPEPVEAYRVLLELSALGSLVGYVIGAMLLPILFKRLGWWH